MSEMVPWYSEDTIDRLRRLLTLLRRHSGLSLDALAANLGSADAGPSASTLGRFLSGSADGPGSELSVRHIREILRHLGDLLTQHAPSGEIFVKACADDLAFFGLLGDASGAGHASRAASPEDQALRKALPGAYLIARAAEDAQIVLSLADFAPLSGPGQAGVPGCVVHRVVPDGRPVLMPCEVQVLNRLLYLRGENPMNTSLRFLCFAGRDLAHENFVGFVTGFEAPGVSFSSKCLMARLVPGLRIEDLTGSLTERVGQSAAAAAVARLATNADGAAALLQLLDDTAYARIVPDFG
jgi:hypothetical protein